MANMKMGKPPRIEKMDEGPAYGKKKKKKKAIPKVSKKKIEGVGKGGGKGTELQIGKSRGNKGSGI